MTNNLEKIAATPNYLDPATGCRTLDNHRDPREYVRMRFGDKTLYAHRVIYEARCGELWPGQEVRHTCENKACLSPIHLEATTRGDRPPAGGGKKHLAVDARRGVVMALLAGDETQRQIASRYGVSTQTVYNINRKRKKDRDQIVTSRV